MADNHVQDAPVVADAVWRSHSHEHLNTNIASFEQPVHTYAEPESKRTKPWRRGWSSNYDDYHLPRTYHRDNITTPNPSEGYYGQGYYGRDPQSAQYPTEQRQISGPPVHRDNITTPNPSEGYYGQGYYGRDPHTAQYPTEQRRINGPPVHSRFGPPRVYHRDNFRNSRHPYNYHGHEYYAGNYNSTGHRVRQYVDRQYADRQKNWANWRDRTSDYDRRPQPWTNHRENTSYQSLRDEYHGRGNYGMQNRVTGHKFPAREESRTYYTRGVVAPPLQSDDNLESVAAPSGMLSASETKPSITNNDCIELMGLVPCEGNPSMEQIESVEQIESEKVESEAQQPIDSSPLCEETAIVRAPPSCLRRKLLILDVNGLLADVIFPAPKIDKADINIARRAIFKRPFVNDFLKFCFERFDVGIWSSRTKGILDRVVDYLLGDMKYNLLFCWDQSHCTKTGFKTLQNKHKELLLKEVKKVWEKAEANLPWEKEQYDESNTLLLDDSPYKALLNPMHTAIFPHSYSYKDGSDSSLGPGGDLRGYLQGLAASENVKKYVEEHPFGQTPIDETSSSWPYYLKGKDGGRGFEIELSLSKHELNK